MPEVCPAPVPVATVAAMADVHTRKLRSFVAVAEELHFSRAAERLFIAQQALSRQIRDLETEVGAQLFVRTTREVRLTPAGEAYLAGVRAALAALDDAAASASRLHHTLSGTLRVGFIAGAAVELTEPILRTFGEEFPEVDVKLQEFGSTDTTAGLASGATDVVIVRLPLGLAGIESESLFTEPLVAMVGPGHRLAARAAVSVSELLDDPITVSDTADETYRAFWRLDDARGDRPAEVVPISSVTEEWQIVAAGRAIALTAASLARYLPLSVVSFVPVTDWPGSTVAVAWRSGAGSPLVEQFVRVARDVRDAEPGLIRSIEHPVA